MAYWFTHIIRRLRLSCRKYFSLARVVSSMFLSWTWQYLIRHMVHSLAKISRIWCGEHIDKLTFIRSTNELTYSWTWRGLCVLKTSGRLIFSVRSEKYTFQHNANIGAEACIYSSWVKCISCHICTLFLDFKSFRHQTCAKILWEINLYYQNAFEGA